MGIPQSRARLYLLLLNRCTLVRQLKTSTTNAPTLPHKRAGHVA
jgi:hypothetical protein